MWLCTNKRTILETNVKHRKLISKYFFTFFYTFSSKWPKFLCKNHAHTPLRCCF